MAALIRTEHDHVELSANVERIRALVDAVGNGARSVGDVYEAFANEVERLVEHLVVHFDREEQGLFPFLARELPDAVSTLESLESTHDAVCGALLRIAGIVRNGAEGLSDHWPNVVALFRRFDAVYVTHAREEASFLRDLGARLDARQRVALVALLDGI